MHLLCCFYSVIFHAKHLEAFEQDIFSWCGHSRREWRLQWSRRKAAQILNGQLHRWKGHTNTHTQLERCCELRGWMWCRFNGMLSVFSLQQYSHGGFFVLKFHFSKWKVYLNWMELMCRKPVSKLSKLANWPDLTSDGIPTLSAADRSSSTESVCFSVRGARASVRWSHNDNFSHVSLSVWSKWQSSVDAIACSAPTSAATRTHFLFRDCGRGQFPPPRRGSAACLSPPPRRWRRTFHDLQWAIRAYEATVLASKISYYWLLIYYY